MAEEERVNSKVGLNELPKKSVTISIDDGRMSTAVPQNEPKIESSSNPKIESSINPKIESSINPKIESPSNPKVGSSIVYPKDILTHPKAASVSHPTLESSSSHPKDPNASLSQQNRSAVPAQSDEVSRLIAVMIASSSKRTQIFTNAEPSHAQQDEEEDGEDQPEDNIIFLLRQIESEESGDSLSARGRRKALKLQEFQKRAQILYHYNEDYVNELTITIQNLINKLRKFKIESQRAIDGIKAETDQTDAGNTKDMAHKQEQLNIVYQTVLKMVTRWRRKIDKFETAMKKKRNQLESRFEALIERYDAEMTVRQDNLDKVEENNKELEEELDRLTKLDTDTQKRWAGMIGEIHVRQVDEAMRAKLKKKPPKKGKGSKGKSKKKGGKKGKKGSKGKKGGKGSKKSKGGKKGSKGTKPKGKSKGKGKKGKKKTQESGEDTDGEGENEEGLTSGEENTGDSRKASKEDKAPEKKKHKGARKTSDTTKGSEKERKTSTGSHDKKSSKKAKAGKSPQAPAHKESESVQGEYDNEEDLMSEFAGEYDKPRADSQAESQTTAPATEKKNSKGQGGKNKSQGGKSGKKSKKKK